MVPRFAILDPRYFAAERTLTDDEFVGTRRLLDEVKRKGCLIIDDRELLIKELVRAASACRAAPPPHDERKIQLAVKTAELLTTDATCVLEARVPAHASTVPLTLDALSRVKVVDAVFLAEHSLVGAPNYPISQIFDSPAYVPEGRIRIDATDEREVNLAADPYIRAMLERVLFHSRSLRVIDRYLFRPDSPERSERALEQLLYAWDRPDHLPHVRLDLFTVRAPPRDGQPAQTTVERQQQCLDSILKVLRRVGWRHVKVRVKVLESGDAPHDRFIISDRGAIEISAGVDRLGGEFRDGFSMSFDRKFSQRNKRLEDLGRDSYRDIP